MDLGSRGFEGRFYCIFFENISSTTPYNYSTSFWTSHFQDLFQENPAPIIFMFLGLVGRVHGSENQLLLISETPILQQIKQLCFFRNMIVLEESFRWKFLGKEVDRTIRKMTLISFRNLILRSISSRRPEMVFGNMGSISSRKHDSAIW